jgi:hypothetical protein
MAFPSLLEETAQPPPASVSISHNKLNGTKRLKQQPATEKKRGKIPLLLLRRTPALRAGYPSAHTYGTSSKILSEPALD